MVLLSEDVFKRCLQQNGNSTDPDQTAPSRAVKKRSDLIVHYMLWLVCPNTFG